MKENRPVRVMIVDDDRMLGRTLVEALKVKGFCCTVAGSAKECFAALEQAVPDIVILDVKLSDSTGFEICRKIKLSPVWKVPVILMTGEFIATNDKVLGMEIGADDYLIKPFSIDELILKINNILSAYSLSAG